MRVVAAHRKLVRRGFLSSFWKPISEGKIQFIKEHKPFGHAGHLSRSCSTRDILLLFYPRWSRTSPNSPPRDSIKKTYTVSSHLSNFFRLPSCFLLFSYFYVPPALATFLLSFSSSTYAFLTVLFAYLLRQYTNKVVLFIRIVIKRCFMAFRLILKRNKGARRSLSWGRWAICNNHGRLLLEFLLGLF